MFSGTRKPLREVIVSCIIGIIFIIFGIIMIRDNNKAFDEYKNSSDKQTVEANITSVYVRKERKTSSSHSYGSKYVIKYDCSLEYTINGNLIKNKETYSSEKKVGDKITLNVYKDKYGNYQIARVTSEKDRDDNNFWGQIIIVVGVVAIGVGIF